MKVAFIKANKVVKAHPLHAILAIADCNLKKDWQAIKSAADDVQDNWNYDPETEQFSAPE